MSEADIRIRAITAVITAALISLTGCGSFNENSAGYAAETRFYFDTAVSLQIYDDRADELMEGCLGICEELEDVLSAQRESSELYKVNHSASPGADREAETCLRMMR